MTPPSAPHAPAGPGSASPAETLAVGGMTLASRLVVGTGKYRSYAEMARCLELSGTDCVTVAVRRERLVNAAGENILDHLDPARSNSRPSRATRTASSAVKQPAVLGRIV